MQDREDSSTLDMQRVQDEDAVGVARQGGGAGQAGGVEQAQRGRVGRQRQVAGRRGGPQQAQVRHLVVVPDELPRQRQRALAALLLQRQEGISLVFKTA